MLGSREDRMAAVWDRIDDEAMYRDYRQAKEQVEWQQVQIADLRAELEAERRKFRNVTSKLFMPTADMIPEPLVFEETVATEPRWRRLLNWLKE